MLDVLVTALINQHLHGSEYYLGSFLNSGLYLSNLKKPAFFRRLLISGRHETHGWKFVSGLRKFKEVILALDRSSSLLSQMEIYSNFLVS